MLQKQVFLNGLLQKEGEHFDFVIDNDGFPCFAIKVKNGDVMTVLVFFDGVLTETRSYCVLDTEPNQRVNWWLPQHQMCVKPTLLSLLKSWLLGKFFP
jgi:hypothetical protein